MLSTTRFHALLIIAALLLPSSVASKEPRPSPGETSKPQQNQPQGFQQPATADQRGTEQLPLIIKSLPTQRAQEEAEQERKDHDAKTANDEEVIRRLVVIGWVQVAVFFMQLFVFGYQAWKLRQTVDAAANAKASAEANRITREQVELTHRARVSILNATVKRGITQKKIVCTYALQNSGEMYRPRVLHRARG